MRTSRTVAGILLATLALVAGVGVLVPAGAQKRPIKIGFLAPLTGGAAQVGREGLILFDGVCNLCSWSVQFLAPRDRGKVLWFAPMQSVRGQAVLAAWSIPRADWETFVLVEDGHAYFRSEAFFSWDLILTMNGCLGLLRIACSLPDKKGGVRETSSNAHVPVSDAKSTSNPAAVNTSYGCRASTKNTPVLCPSG